LLGAVRTLDARERDVVVGFTLGFTLFGAVLGTLETLVAGRVVFAATGGFVVVGTLAGIGALAGVLLGVLLAAFMGVRAEALAGVFRGVLPGVFPFIVVVAMASMTVFGAFSSSE
jgi:hypothetical protein